MEISLNWLNEYVDIKRENVKELADKITKAGVAIEKITKLCDVEGLIVGEIKSITKHADSDKLNVCMVNNGNEILQIVCGASNVAEGKKIILSPVGTVLPGDFKIKSANIRGVESNGMICALEEIGIPKEFLTEEEINGIHILTDEAVVGDNALNYINLGDTIYGLDLNPNRSDCLSMVGFAYEVAAILGKEVKLPETTINAIEESSKDIVVVEVNTENCKYYTTRVVKNIHIKESPDFIKARLIASGMRPINNVVDISNYVMLEYGQPLHFFDANKLNEKIEVRMAKSNEEVITIDNKTRKLVETDIVICNDTEVVAVAGVMGCSNSEVDDNTKDIIIESAIFNPYNIRYTSIKLDLRSEASIRFEKGLDPNKTEEALNRAVYLLEKYADAIVLKDIVKFEDIDKVSKEINISLEKINSVLGIDITEEEVSNIFKRLNFESSINEDIFNVIVPTRRGDISIPEDLIEEVGRLYGYHNIKGKLPKGILKDGKMSDLYRTRKEIRGRLESLGFYQMRTFSLVEEKTASMFTNDDMENVNILMPMSSEKEVMRRSLIPSLLDVVDYNTARNWKDIMIYEVSSTYGYNEEYIENWKVSGVMLGNYFSNSLEGKVINTNFYTIKGVVLDLLNYLGLNNRYIFDDKDIPKEFHPGMSASIKIGNDVIGYVGKVHPGIHKNNVYVFELSISKIMDQKVRGIKYKEPSKYPAVTRDMSIILDKSILAEEVIRVIKKAGGPLLNEVNVFDVYSGDKLSQDKKSIALNLVFMDNERTLTENEVKEVFDSIISKVCNTLDAELRS